MNDRADTRLREIAIRVAEMAPEAPPFPDPVAVRLTTRAEPKRRSLRPGLVVGIAAAVVLLVAVGFPLLFSSRSDSPAPPATEGPEPTAPPSVETTVVSAPRLQGPALVPATEGNVMNLYAWAPGSGVRKLTDHTGRNDYVGYPSLSPDGETILFEARRDGSSTIQVYVANVDGTNPTRLSDAERRESFQPEWSPDGSQIVFVRSVSAYSRSAQEVWVMNADGSNPRMLSAGDSRGPEWSPDGETIAFLHDEETWIVPASGGSLARITDIQAAPDAWSPDGMLLIVEAAAGAERGGPHDQASDLWLVSADGAVSRRLTDAPGRDWGARWSPDGTRILFNSDRDGDTEIYSMNADGSGLTRLTNSEGIDGAGRWSADGTQILFIAERDGAFSLYLMGADGSGQRPVWNSEAVPVWFAGLDWRS